MPHKRQTKRTKTAPVTESVDQFDMGFDYPSRDFFIGSDLIGSRRQYWQTQIDDRTEGRWLPIYESEYELAEIRAKGRKLASLISVATGAQSALANYVLGNGFKFTVKPVDEEEGIDEELIGDVEDFVESFLDDNDFNSGELAGLDRDIHDRSREDGEAIVGLYLIDPETVRLRVIDPSHLTEPLNQRQLEDYLGVGDSELSYWKFGVHTRHDPVLNCEDVERPLGYHLVYDSTGSNWDYMPSNRIVHLKRNVGRGAKRGVSDYYAIWRYIERLDKLAGNVAEGAAVQAAIAFIREHVESATQSGIAAMVSSNANANYDQQIQTGSRNVKVERYRPGTIKDIPFGMKYHAGPLGTPGHLVFIEVIQVLYRVCGVRWNMPEYLISGDASNANLASSLVAESPFVKAREADQQFYKGAYLAIIWKALRLAFDAGRFENFAGTWDDFEDAIDVVAEAPEVASRDGLKSAQENTILFDKGIMSAPTWAAKAGLDYDDEIRNGAKAAAPAAAPGGQGDNIDPFATDQTQEQPAAAPDEAASESITECGMDLTDEDNRLGAIAAKQASQGRNPASWVADEATWEKAKEAAKKGGYEGDSYWAVVTSIYKRMGGAVKGNASESLRGGAHIAERPFVIQKL